MSETSERPWGSYTTLCGSETGSGYKVKRIVVLPGKRLSLQSHAHRSEHWVIAAGSAKVELNGDVFMLSKDQYIYIPVGAKHRIENVGEALLEFVETQCGAYLGEDDIVRYEDDYGRA